MPFTVSIAYVGESEHKPSHEEFDDVVSFSIDDGGGVKYARAGGQSAALSATSWGAVKVVRVSSAADRT